MHPNTAVVVWNDLADGGRLTVVWCLDCGAIKRDFPKMKIDWERPRNTADIYDDLDSTG